MQNVIYIYMHAYIKTTIIQVAADKQEIKILIGISYYYSICRNLSLTICSFSLKRKKLLQDFILVKSFRSGLDFTLVQIFIFSVQSNLFTSFGFTII